MSTAAETQSPAYAGEIRKRPFRFSIFGALLVGLGAIAIGSAFAATVTTIFVIGALLIIAGLAEFLDAGRGEPLERGGLLLGLLHTALGLALVLKPVVGAIGVTLLLCVHFAAAGVIRLAIAIKRRHGRSRGGWAFAGVVDLLLAVLIGAQWPESAAWVVGVLIGIQLVVYGIGLIAIASEGHRSEIPA